MRHVSRRGLIEIACHEGIVTSPYKDSVGVWTVGIGHTARAGTPDPATERREFPINEIMDIFARDIKTFEDRVRRAFKRPLSQEQFDAAVCFDFNTGGIHRASWVKHFDNGDRARARKAFMAWRKPSEIIPRRGKERDLFFDGVYSSGGYATVYPASSSGTVQWQQGERVRVAALMDGPRTPSEKPVRPEPSRETRPKPPPDGAAGGSVQGSVRGIVAIGTGIVAAISAAAALLWEKTKTLWSSLTWLF